LRRQKRCPHCRSKLTLEELGSCKYLQRVSIVLLSASCMSDGQPGGYRRTEQVDGQVLLCVE